MGPTREPSEETVAAIDAVFEEGSPAAAQSEQPPAPAAPGKPQVNAGDDSEPPLEDYVRELGQEYQQEQDEGKL